MRSVTKPDPTDATGKRNQPAPLNEAENSAPAGLKTWCDSEGGTPQRLARMERRIVGWKRSDTLMIHVSETPVLHEIYKRETGAS